MSSFPLTEVPQPILELSLRYSELEDIIRDASQYGPSPLLEDRYSLVRTWLMVHYPRLKSALTPHMPAGQAPSSHTLMGEGKDAFETLFVPPTLDSLMRTTGRSLHRGLRETREAFSALGVPASGLIH